MKGNKALETVFMLFLLVIVILVIVQLFVRGMKKGEKGIVDIYNSVSEEQMKKAIQMCSSKCSDYMMSSSPTDLVTFCTSNIGIDIDNSGSISEYEPTLSDLSQGKRVLLPQLPYVVCETNIYCPQVVSCNERLNLGGCVDVLCKKYFQDYKSLGMSDRDAATRATERVKSLYSPGKCKIDEIIRSQEARDNGIPEINWYKEMIGNLDCSKFVGLS